MSCSSLEKSIKYLRYLPNHVFDIQQLTRINILEVLNVSASTLCCCYLIVMFGGLGADRTVGGLLLCRTSQNSLQIRKMKM